MNISLDTNAVLDLCYRVYPETIFPTLWTDLQVCQRAGHLKLYLCDTAWHEIEQKIEMFDFDKQILKGFINRFSVIIVQRGMIANKIIDIKSKLLPHAPNSRYVTQEMVDVDVIALGLRHQCTVITAEIGDPNFNLSTLRSKPNLKIPNVCDHCGVKSSNWAPLFEQLGIKI